MLSFDGLAIRRDLGHGLTLRTIADEGDVERVAAFNTVIHGANVGELVRRICMHHPHIRADGFILVQDEATGQVVSSLSLHPWRWRYAGQELLVGEMGFVGTLESHRGRGLVRAQVSLFKELLREQGCHLSIIQGIPYYYRQFGYEYAVPLENHVRLELHQVPGPVDAPTHTCRPAGQSDFPALVRLYTEATWDLDVYAERDKATWRYIWEQSPGTEMEAEVWLVEDRARQPAGYFRVQKHPLYGPGLTTNEVSRLSPDAAGAVLRQLAALARERGNPFIRLNLPADCMLVRAAQALGAVNQGGYAWQVYIPDPPQLLRAIAPALERRVVDSVYAGLTTDLRIHLFRASLLLRWRTGRLVDVEWLTPAGDWGTLRLPASLLAPVILGHWSWQELARTRPDVAASGEWVPLLDVLFPPLRAYIYQIY
ncbi:MAG: GNAT family N-acetyltransferase [Chloroflexi bacterium]|nr:GNAT family N-acetyltransferase [Chloroflexota bacterium]MBU1748687.1 GNAT family N-acetyltransferase [Chloroflexota bacterium]